MGMMPHTVDNSVVGFQVVKGKLNEDLGNQNGAGRTLRTNAIEKLDDLNTRGAWHELLDSLLFFPGLNPGTRPGQGGDVLDKIVWDEVYKHFKDDWTTTGWFPNISHATFLKEIGRGFLGALWRADQVTGNNPPLPIEVIWVCSDPDPNSVQMFVEHVWNDLELIVVIATPVPKLYNPSALGSTTNDAIFMMQAEKSEEIIENRIHIFEEAANDLERLGVDVPAIISELRDMIVPETIEQAEELDQDAENLANRTRLAIEMIRLTEVD